MPVIVAVNCHAGKHQTATQQNYSSTMTDDQNVFVQNVRKLMDARGINQTELARQVSRRHGIAVRTVTSVIQGVPKSTTLRTASGIAETLGVHISLMFLANISVADMTGANFIGVIENLSKLPADAKNYVFGIVERETVRMSDNPLSSPSHPQRNDH